MNIKEMQQRERQKSSFTKQKLMAIFTVIFVWILIIFLTISYLTLFAPLMFTYNPTQFYILIPIILVSLCFGCYSYFMSIFVSPGYPNTILNQIYKNKLQQFQHQGRLQSQLKRKRRQISSKTLIENLTYYSYCFKCQNVKLPRTHHCKICGICITRMDHHCPWIGNCVGKYNHKYFILFQLYTTIGLIIVAASIVADIINNQEMISRLIEMQRYIVIVTAIMSFMLLISIGFLLVTQIIMVTLNYTTLQSFYDGLQQQNNNPFDTGSIVKNIKQIAGDSFWFLPTDPFPQKKIMIQEFKEMSNKPKIQQRFNTSNKQKYYNKNYHNGNNFQHEQKRQNNYDRLYQNDDILNQNTTFFNDEDEIGRNNLLMSCC